MTHRTGKASALSTAARIASVTVQTVGASSPGRSLVPVLLDHGRPFGRVGHKLVAKRERHAQVLKVRLDLRLARTAGAVVAAGASGERAAARSVAARVCKVGVVKVEHARREEVEEGRHGLERLHLAVLPLRVLGHSLQGAGARREKG